MEGCLNVAINTAICQIRRRDDRKGLQAGKTFFPPRNGEGQESCVGLQEQAKSKMKQWLEADKVWPWASGALCRLHLRLQGFPEWIGVRSDILNLDRGCTDVAACPTEAAN